VHFECDEQQARLKMSEAELAAARESHEAKLRLQGLQQAGEVEVSMAASAAERARAQVELTRAQLNQCAVVAPFSGRVVKVAAKPFQSVSAGQPLLELVSDGPLKLRLNVPGKWVSWLKKGTKFNVQIDETSKSYHATVIAINGRIDAVSQTVEVEAAIDQRAPDLLPGMSGTARLAPGVR
jgi:membrane fusion protein, multidrug efflux system